MKAQLNGLLKNSISNTFSMFSSIILEDSSQISLNEMLSASFEGCGGGASKSSFKINFIYDILNSVVVGIKIINGLIPDQANASEIIKRIEARSLILRDLGYFVIEALQKIEDAKAYYLARLSISTNVYLNKDDKQPINVPEFLKEQMKNGNTSINRQVYLGKDERFPTRLVAEPVPEQVIRQRKAKYKKENGKEPSPYYTEWCGFAIFITNIPEEMFSGTMIVALYKIRWQYD